MFGGGIVDEIPPERMFVVTVLLGGKLVVEEYTVSCSEVVTREGERPDDVFW